MLPLSSESSSMTIGLSRIISSILGKLSTALTHVPSPALSASRPTIVMPKLTGFPSKSESLVPVLALR
jgi:hypothetical protein